MLVEVTTRNYVTVIKQQFKTNDELESFPNKIESSSMVNIVFCVLYC